MSDTPSAHPSTGKTGARVAALAAGAAGVVGSVACAAAMTLAALGVGASATATGMAGMGTSGDTPGLLGVLIRIGPVLLIASIALVTIAFALRRPAGAVLALAPGALMYAGMYAQPSMAAMYASIAVGYVAWIGVFLWIRRPDR